MKILNTLLLLSIILFISNPILAQDKEEKNHKVAGLRFGWHGSQYFQDGNSLTGTTYNSSFYVGLYRDNYILPFTHIGGGVEYFQNGAKVDDNNKRILHYIAVPIYIKAKIGPVFALTGFEPSFKVAEKQYVLGSKVDPLTSSEWFDIPFFLGAGLKIFFVSVEVRYHWGLLNVYKGVNEKETSSQYIQIGAAVSF